MTRFFFPNTSSGNELNNVDVAWQTFLTAVVKNWQKHERNNMQYACRRLALNI